MYEFAGDDYQKKKDLDKQVVEAAQWDEDEKVTYTRRSGKVVYAQFEKREIRLPEYHLYRNKDRLIELLNKENDLRYNAMLMREKREYVPPQLEELSPEEEAEKQELLDSGLTHWTKNDFYAFVRANELFGRENYQAITKVSIKSGD